MVLTARVALVALLVATAATVVGSWTVLGVGDGLLVAAGVVDVAVAAGVRQLRLTRDGDTAVRLGETATVRLRLANPGRRRLRGTVRDAWVPSAGASGPLTVDVAAGATARVDTVLAPTRRGALHPDRVTVRSLGPLGLAGRQGAHRVEWSLRALPPFTSRVHLPSRLARLRDLEGRSVSLLRGPGTEFDSLREYVPGDDVRSIDWRASARASDVMVRTWRPERDRRLVLVIDTGRLAAGRVGDAPRLDAALDAALLLAALAAAAGDQVDLLAYDRGVQARTAGLRGSAVLPAVVDATLGLQAALVETDWSGLVTTLLARRRARSLVVLLTGLDPAAARVGLLPVLGRLTARHTVLLGAVADPAVTALAGGRGSPAAVYAAAAAERTRADREALATTLALRGVAVVQQLPDALAPALADAYLAAKAAGRL